MHNNLFHIRKNHLTNFCLLSLVILLPAKGIANEDIFWSSVNCANKEEVMAYLSAYPNGEYKNSAERCISALETPVVIQNDPIALNIAELMNTWSCKREIKKDYTRSEGRREELLHQVITALPKGVDVAGKHDSNMREKSYYVHSRIGETLDFKNRWIYQSNYTLNTSLISQVVLDTPDNDPYYPDYKFPSITVNCNKNCYYRKGNLKILKTDKDDLDDDFDGNNRGMRFVFCTANEAIKSYKKLNDILENSVSIEFYER